MRNLWKDGVRLWWRGVECAWGAPSRSHASAHLRPIERHLYNSWNRARMSISVILFNPEVPTLDSRFHGNDGYAKVTPRRAPKAHVPLAVSTILQRRTIGPSSGLCVNPDVGPGHPAHSALETPFESLRTGFDPAHATVHLRQGERNAPPPWFRAVQRSLE